MFAPNSRYVASATYAVTLPGGRTVTAVALPLPAPAPLAGYHPRAGGERLDLIAARYLNAPTGFWRLCDANNAMVPAALAARTLIGIPRSGGR